MYRHQQVVFNKKLNIEEIFLKQIIKKMLLNCHQNYLKDDLEHQQT